MNTNLDIVFTILTILHVAVAELLKEQRTYFPTAPISTLLLSNLLNNIKNCKEEILSPVEFQSTQVLLYGSTNYSFKDKFRYLHYSEYVLF